MTMRCAMCGNEIGYGTDIPATPLRYMGRYTTICATHIWENRGRYTRCQECGDIVDTETCEMYDVDGRHICDECFENRTQTCHECGEVHFERNGKWVGNNWYCNEHAPKIGEVHGYSYKPSPVYNGGEIKNGETDELLFGVELEIDNGSSAHVMAGEIEDITDNVYCKHDGSLHDEGVEIVSHPCTLSYHENKLGWDEIMNTAKNLEYEGEEAGTCGLHVHVGRKQLGGRTNVAKVVMLVNRHWNSLFDFSRREEDKLREWANKPDIYETEKMMNGIEPVDADYAIEEALGTRDDGRYQAINLENRNTIEFRLFNSTLYFSEMKATLQLVNNICKYAMKHSVEEVLTSDWNEIIEEERFDELEKYVERMGITGKKRSEIKHKEEENPTTTACNYDTAFAF